MTRDEIDRLWQKALHGAILAGEQYTRYHFANLIAAEQQQRIEQLEADTQEVAAARIYLREKGALLRDLAASQAQIKVLREALEQYKCVKCGGDGWLWGDQLDNPSEETAADTMTKYSCDGLTCEALRAMDALANHAKTSSSPVAWNGGKEGREWTTDPEVAANWLIENPTYQAVPLYDDGALQAAIGDAFEAGRRAEREEIALALSPYDSPTKTEIQRMADIIAVELVAAIRARGDIK